MASVSQEQPPQAVRFSNASEGHDSADRPRHTGGGQESEDMLSPEAREEIRTVSRSVQQAQCQARRLENFSFEPVSLPASRAPSPSPATRTPSGHSAFRGLGGHRPSPPPSAMHSPPLTPAGSGSHEGRKAASSDDRKQAGDVAMMTPQISPPHEPPPTSMEPPNVDGGRSAAASRSPRDTSRSSPRPTSLSDVPGVVDAHPKQPPTFTVGPAGDSIPPSRDTSPSGSTGIRTPGARASGASTPAYGRPFTPAGDREDPYARSKRPPQARNFDALDPRFIFGHRHRKERAYSPPASTLPRSKGSEEMSGRDDKKSVRMAGGSKHDPHASADESDGRSAVKGHHHGSMSELKRFFRLGKSKEKRAQSPTPSTKSEKPSTTKRRTGYMTPPRTDSQEGTSVPFADDHGLESRYGKFGKVLGSGAGGSVRLMKRSSDGVTFAVKQFRAKHSYESEKEYKKKVTAEFCIGSTLHHGNIIETMDLVNEKGNYYVVMEYAPFDLFAIVMTGKMSREEVSCCTLQILNGVSYLHKMGLAHRDLKLDNVVVNEHGIMKIIDFGSATVFRYPFENEIVLASGIVGSDPYLAPEVYDNTKYDPQPADIWSLAIIFCCMTLRRFPWKQPRVSDNSYKLFVSPPNDGPRSITDGGHRGTHSEPASRQPSGQTTATHQHKQQVDSSAASTHEAAQDKEKEKQPPAVIKGPWRLLRLLPRESRHIIGRMLEVDPKKRATLSEIMYDKWVTNSQVCSQEESGRVLAAENHEHTLEGSAAAAPSAPPSKQQQR
ncbi:Pkinase-domain-containing protein [Sporormia fimetaria CBS 119925]|uniref:non-specific serine/threonine protein kinase n=1 Tax=Sporormia fimetaria CBS 119925 TaxID=1340428 RepID=A0A6A6V0X2_9PLEO|nr:Pkinase-domain-containing protein [Sporormia fimetaria CBS 119925]